MTGPLSDDEVEEFIERGYVWVRGAFTPERAQEIVASVFAPDGTMEAAYKRTTEGNEPHDISGLPLSDCTVWPANRMDVDTGFQTRIEELSPKLAAVLRQLAGTAEIKRPHVGERWILNLEIAERPESAARLLHYQRGARWHIDTPGTDTSLEDRFDAFTLLVLWSDVAEGGGGTLVSSEAFHRFVDALIEREDGVDTKRLTWGEPFIEGCQDIESQVGRAGDVLVGHAFLLHARPMNYRKEVRILENPTVTVGRPLDYSPSNAAPSAVEEAVIRHIRRRADVPAHMRARLQHRRSLDEAARRLVEAYPSRFLPTAAESDESEASRLADAVDVLLFDRWVDGHARSMRLHQRTAIPVAKAAARVVRRLMVSQRALPESRGAAGYHNAEFFGRRWSRLLLGLTNCEGLNHAMRQILVASGIEVHPFETRDAGGTHSLLLVIENERAALVDAWSDCSPLWVEGLEARPLFRCWHEPGRTIVGPLEGAVPWEEWTARGATWVSKGLAPRNAFLEGIVVDPSHLESVMPRSQGPEVVRRFLDLEPTESRPFPASWTEYLRLRARIVNDELADPKSAMRDYVREHRVGGLTRRLVNALVERM